MRSSPRTSGFATPSSATKLSTSGGCTYLDYEKAFIGTDNIFAPLMCKRDVYEHEREVRAIHHKIPFVDPSHIDYRRPSPLGLAVAVDLQVLLRELHVSPGAPAGFAEQVGHLTEQHGLTFQVRPSDLDGTPGALNPDSTSGVRAGAAT